MSLNSIRRWGAETYVTVKDIGHELKKVEWAPTLNRFYTLDGLEKIVKVFIPSLELTKMFSSLKVHKWLQIAKGQKELILSTMIVPSLNRFINKISVTNAFLLMASVSGTGYTLKKLAVFDFAMIGNVINKMGQVQVFQLRFFKFCFDSPTDFFISLAAINDLKDLTIESFREVKVQPEKKLTPEQSLAKKREELLFLVNRVALVITFFFKIYCKEGEARFGTAFTATFHIFKLLAESISMVRFILK